MASAVAATRATALAASVATRVGESSEKVIPMPGFATANELGKGFADALGSAATTAESYLGSSEQSNAPIDDDDWEMALAMALSLSEQGLAAAAAMATPQATAEDEQLKVALAMSLADAAGPQPDIPAPQPDIPATDAEPVLKPVTAPIAAKPVAEPSPVPSKDEAQDDAHEDASEDASEDGDGVLVDVSDVAATISEEEEEEPVWLREAGQRLGPESFVRLLDDLSEMGFNNRELNERMLAKHDGNLKRAVRELVDEMYA